MELGSHGNAGKDQVERWRAFDDEYALDLERTDTRLVVHYAKVDGSARRLRALVAAESACCSFVDWAIDDSHADLRLIVTGGSDCHNQLQESPSDADPQGIITTQRRQAKF